MPSPRLARLLASGGGASASPLGAGASPSFSSGGGAGGSPSKTAKSKTAKSKTAKRDKAARGRGAAAAFAGRPTTPDGWRALGCTTLRLGGGFGEGLGRGRGGAGDCWERLLGAGPCVTHALKVVRAVRAGRHAAFFALHATAPCMSG